MGQGTTPRPDYSRRQLKIRSLLRYGRVVRRLNLAKGGSLMTACATTGMRFGTQTNLALEATFDGGRITSDGGLVWLAEADSELGLCERVAEHVPEWRKRKGGHSLEAL